MLPRLALLGGTRRSSPLLSTAAGWSSPAFRAAWFTTTTPNQNKAPKTATPPPDLARGATCDLLDIFHPRNVDDLSSSSSPAAASNQPTVQIAEPIFRDFGGRLRFSGQAATVKCFENNPLVRAALEEPGRGRVLVVDGGGSKRCALLGDNIAAMGARNGWSGVIIHGCVRDTADLATFDLGVKALAAYPLKSSKRDPGQRDVPVSFAGVTVRPGDWVYADGDGVVVSDKELRLSSDV
jgi:regulator of ribonuclease activity A